MQFSNSDKFIEFTGMLDSEEQFKKLKIKPCEPNGMFQVDRLDELKAFCKKNPKYHIITVTSDGDESERSHPDHTMSNQIRFVNRMGFYLGTGSKLEDAYLCEECDCGECE